MSPVDLNDARTNPAQWWAMHVEEQVPSGMTIVPSPPLVRYLPFEF